MSEENVEIVQDTFAATSEGDFDRAIGHYDDDAELVIPRSDFLDAGTFSGREAVWGWFSEWFLSFAPGYQFEVEEVRDLGDTVMVVAHHWGRGRASGVAIEGRTGYLFRLREGKIVRVELFASRAAALEAAGLSE